MSVAVSFLSKSFRSRASFANFALSIIATLLFPAPKAQNDLNTSSILILVFLEFSFDGLMFLAAAYTHVARGTNTFKICNSISQDYARIYYSVIDCGSKTTS